MTLALTSLLWGLDAAPTDGASARPGDAIPRVSPHESFRAHAPPAAVEREPADGVPPTSETRAPLPAAAPLSPAARRVLQFRNDLRAFALDLERIRPISRARAHYLAYYAVSEAYRQNIPPALVFAVMLVENTTLSSTATSSVGAMGLMQVMPQIWVPVLGRQYGWDLRNDATNLGMGVHVLAEVTRVAKGDWRTALLRYNGCVHGTNTPDCFRYPDKVRRMLELHARALCPSRSFEACVAQPLFALYGYTR